MIHSENKLAKNLLQQLPTVTPSHASMNRSYLSYLECSGCGEHYSPHQIHTFCPNCQSPLLSRYELDQARLHVDRDEIKRRKKGMWRWHELLPVLHEENQIFL